MNKIQIAGIGPGSKDYLLPIVNKIVKQSDVIIGGSRALKLFNEFDKEKIKITANLNRVKEFIADNITEKKIVVLVSGDPGLYSMLSYLKRFFSRDKIEVIPGISSLQLGFARAGLVWQDAKFLSLHGNDNKNKLLQELKNNHKIGFLTDDSFPPQQIIDYLINKGIENKKVIVAENLSYPSERVVEGTLRELANKDFSGLSVMVICDDSLEI